MSMKDVCLLIVNKIWYLISGGLFKEINKEVDNRRNFEEVKFEIYVLLEIGK